MPEPPSIARMAGLAAGGFAAFVVVLAVLGAVGGIDRDRWLLRLVVYVAAIAPLLVGIYGLVGLRTVIEARRALDVAVPPDPGLPPAGPAAEVAATAVWLRRRTRRVVAWWGAAAAGLAGFLVSVVAATDLVALALLFVALVCSLAGLANLATRVFAGRRLAEPWQRGTARLAHGTLGLAASINLADGALIEVTVPRLAAWTPLPVPADGEPYTAWWAGPDRTGTGCLATPGGAPVVMTRRLPANRRQ